VSGREPRIARGAPLGPGLVAVAHLARSRLYDVYDAWSNERGCRVIAKTLRPAARDDRGAAARLRREGRMLRALAHPHLVRAYETLPGPPPVLVLETLGGETLAHLIDTRTRRLSAVELSILGLQLASAVGYLHGQGWLHLDLKPSNLVAEAGRAKILDLSVARRPGRSRPGVGTRCYMAPEQARGGELGPPADVWGIGATLWEAATGRLPFGEEDAEAEVDGYPQLERLIEPVSRYRRLPRELERTVRLCLDPEPGRRPSVGRLSSLLADVPGVPDLRRAGAAGWNAAPAGSRRNIPER
jgi:serine/threonine protein kinase